MDGTNKRNADESEIKGMMALAKKPSTNQRKTGAVRRVVGDILIALVLLFTVYLSVVMLQRIHTVVLKATYRKVFHNELILCGILLLFALDVRFGFWTKIRVKALRMFGWAPRVVVTVLAVFIIALCGKVVIGGAVRTAGEAEHVIVLGMALQDGQPTRDLIYRLDTAERYLEDHPNATLILTGGNPNEDGVTEAGVMYRLLTERGVPETRMVLEDKASSTEENFRNSKQFLNADESVVQVTSDYHMDRALRMAKKASIEKCMRLPAPSDAIQYGANVMWEIIMDINDMTAG